MYPLNMQLENGVGFALANDEAEHRALTAAGYAPKFAGIAADDGAHPAAVQVDVEADVPLTRRKPGPKPKVQ